MTTPAINTPFYIIKDGMFDAGKLMEGQDPNSEQLTRGMRILTDVINFEQTQGLKLWLNVDTAIPLVAGQGTYALSPAGDVVMPKPPRAIQGYYVDANNIRRPLNPLSWDDYIRLSQVTQTGSINSFFVNKKQSELSVFFWQVPDATAATGVAHLLLQMQVTNPISVTEEMNFPIEWRSFLHWALADELSTGQPEAIVQRAQQRTAFYRDALQSWDVEDASTSFAPDARGSYQSSRFR
tara:strand:- start:223 stop:936 length:714 start_codon:yes stop_codon:yes gene_type:complete